jgi:hypothetical protein
MTGQRFYGDRPTFGGMLLQYVIVFLIGFVFPGAVTMMAPATWLTFQRSGDVVSCKTRTCMFFIVPFKTQLVDQVTGIETRERAGRTERQREFGKTTSKNVHVDGEGFLQVLGVGDTKLEVNVSPASLKSVVGKANDFLNSNEQGSKTIFAIANWKFGGLMGGVLSLITLLCVVGYTLALLNFVLSSIKRILISPKERN